MGIPNHARRNFATLRRAAENGDLALMECNDGATGAARYVICAVGRDKGGYIMTPLGHLADGNPYEAYIPPYQPRGTDRQMSSLSGSPGES